MEEDLLSYTSQHPRGGQLWPPLVTRRVRLRAVAHSRRGSGQRLEKKNWAIFAILADFAIFSGFLN
jgi:hypothetical protein